MWCFCNRCLVANQDKSRQDVPLLQEGTCSQHKSKYQSRFGAATRRSWVNPPRTLQYPKLGSADNIEDAFREWYRQYINDVRAGKSQRRHKRYGQLSVVSNRITVCLFCVTQDQHINLGSAGPQQMISSSMQQQQHMKKMKKTMVFLCSITWLLLLLLLLAGQ